MAERSRGTFCSKWVGGKLAATLGLPLRGVGIVQLLERRAGGGLVRLEIPGVDIVNVCARGVVVTWTLDRVATWSTLVLDGGMDVDTPNSG